MEELFDVSRGARACKIKKWNCTCTNKIQTSNISKYTTNRGQTIEEHVVSLIELFLFFKKKYLCFTLPWNLF